MENLAKYFDHTNLKAFVREEAIKRLCEEAKQYGFASVCVNPFYVKLVKNFLKDSNVKVCTVVGFPLGATTTEAKICETKQVIKDGADEVDMVINIGALKDGKDDIVIKDIKAVVGAAKKKIVKVILECCYLTDEEKARACALSKQAGANFVKTSTGFGEWGAKIEDVRLMKEIFGGGVKAAGGIKTLEQTRSFIKAGATRIGVSQGVNIMKELEEEQKI